MTQPGSGNNFTGMEVAIIGMACRFPGACSVRQFWENLKNGVESITFFSDRELSEAGVDPRLPGTPGYVRAGGIIENAAYFDAAFFGYSPQEAEIMSPQGRQLYECAWEALEDAGIDPFSSEDRIGLYAGASSSSFWEALCALKDADNVLGQLGASQVNSNDFLTTRLSYKFNLKGPSVMVQSACSTSLAAVHLAVQGILNGECEISLAGGSTFILPHTSGYPFQEEGIMSPDGHCRAFDAGAAGTLSGSGAGIVVLKALEEAVADRDHIYAVIKGSAINNDGLRKPGFSAPSVEGQAEVIAAALYAAGVEAEDISYIETHGTGTPLGDSVEIDALKLAFNTVKKGFCALGSVKTNIGHLDAAAGAAGLIKTVLALKHGIIPPSLHYRWPNPRIDFDCSPFFVNNRPRKWENSNYPLRAGVSSFGIGGTNVHVVLEQAPPGSGDRESPSLRSLYLLPFSARTPAALERMTGNLQAYLQENRTGAVNLADTAYTLQVGRHAMKHRRLVVCGDGSEAVRALAHPGSLPTMTAKEKPSIIFMFPGLGAQYVDMGVDLYRSEPVFRREMDRCFAVMKSLAAYDIKEILYPSSPGFQGGPPHDESLSLYQVEIAQIVIFIFEYALARLLTTWGIRPRAMIGYSFGEYTAACISGVLSLEDTLKLIVTRGELIGRQPGGVMLGVPIPAAQVMPWLGSELSIAVDNGPSCIVSGPPGAMEAFEARMKAGRYLCMRLKAGHAIHSKMMEPVLNEFAAGIAHLSFSAPGIPYISNLSGGWISAEEAASPDYWTAHLRGTVRYADGIKALLELPHPLFIEVGPGRDLTVLVRRYLDGAPDGLAVNLVRVRDREISDSRHLLEKIGRLWLYGVNIDWKAFYGDEKRQRVPLPTYPFADTPYSLAGNPFAMRGRFLEQKPGQPVRKNPDMNAWFYVPVWKQSVYPWSPVIHRGESGADIDRDGDTGTEACCRLVFLDDEGPGERLAAEFLKAGEKVIRVSPGKAFKRQAEDRYVLDPGAAGDYRVLVDELRKLRHLPDRISILHLWSMRPAEIGEALVFGFFSLLYLLQAPGSSGKIRRIDVVTDRVHEVAGEDELHPEAAPLAGLLKVIPQEFPGVMCRHIDIHWPGGQDPRSGWFISRLFAELRGNAPEPEVAYRWRSRWVQTFETLPLERIPRRQFPLKEGGVYWITGGLGGLGLILARYLARTVQARLILTGRRPFPQPGEWEQWIMTHDASDPTSRKIEKLLEIRRLGAGLLIARADAADPAQMKDVLRRAEECFGPVQGIIHAAGVTLGASFDTIERITSNAVEEQFNPKIYGLQVLEQILEDREPDFCLLFSSLSAVLGGLGFSVYSAANYFMDAYVCRHNRHSRFPWLSIDWEGWHHDPDPAPVSPGGKKSLPFSPQVGELAILPEEGEKVVENILTIEGLSRVVVSSGDLSSRIHQWINPQIEMEGVGEGVFTSDAAPGTPLEQMITGAWRRFFGFPVGIHDDFFELGGDSLKAITLIGVIHRATGVQVTLAEFFAAPTPTALAGLIQEKTGEERYRPVPCAEKREYYDLSPAQKRLYILHQTDPRDLSYNLGDRFLLKGTLEREKLDAVFPCLIQRHEILRTSFEMLDGRPVQRIHDEVEWDMEYYNLATEDTEGTEEKDNFVRAFDLSRAPLLRVGVIKLKEDEYVLLVDMHHIVYDGISAEIFFRDFRVLYRGGELPVPVLQYKDYAQWRGSEEQRRLLKQQETYWLKIFAGEIPVLDLPRDYRRPAIRSSDGAVENFEISPAETGRLKELAGQTQSTLFMVVLALFNALLGRLCNREDIVVGTPSAGRKHPDLQGMMGLFLNALAMRNYPVGEMPFQDFLKDVRDRTIAAFDNEDYPFEELVEQVAGPPAAGRSPLFDVMLIFHNEVQETETETPLTPGLSLVHYPVPVTTSKYDLTLIAVEDRGRLQFNVEYCRALFKPGTIRRIMGDFNRYLRAVLDNPAVKLGRVEILSAEEKQQLVEEFNNTRTDYPAYKTVKQLLAEQALKTPDRIAVTAKEGVLPGHRWISLTYRELHEMARRAAWRLKEQYGIRAGDLVACRLSRTLTMITGILAVIKADGVCLPISPQCPPARLELIMKDSCAKVVLTDEDIDIKAAQAPPASDLDAGRDAREPAYVIYTSGSTGRPKGVLLNHRGIINHLYSLFKEFELTGADVFCHNMDISYVVSIWLLVGPPVMGARVFLYPGEIAANALELFRQAEIHGVTVLEVVPPLLKTHLQLLDAGESPVCFRHLRSLILTGERVPPALVNRFYDRYRDRVQLCNAYGQSEGSDDTLYYKIPYNTQTVTVPIGKPSNNTIAFILDRCMNLQSIGIPGELYIAGDCLAPGYLNKPELTAEKFKKNRSYRTYRTYIFFKTGDLARWLTDGNIQFLGRTDHQVKIRGFRIEPAEIENRLLEHSEIKEAVVVAREDEGGDTFLTAYIVGDRPLDISNLRAFLVRQLPDYMVPSHIIQVENIPLTASGKVDRNALPTPERSRPGLETTYVAPRTGSEKEFCEICKRVLKRDQVGIHDNFFELGCNSLMLVQLNTEIKNVFQEDFPVLAMYRHPTIHSLLGYLEAGGEKNADTAGAAGMGVETGEEKEQRMNRAKQLMKRAVRRRENGKPGRGHAF